MIISGVFAMVNNWKLEVYPLGNIDKLFIILQIDKYPLGNIR